MEKTAAEITADNLHEKIIERPTQVHEDVFLKGFKVGSTVYVGTTMPVRLKAAGLAQEMGYENEHDFRSDHPIQKLDRSLFSLMIEEYEVRLVYDMDPDIHVYEIHHPGTYPEVTGFGAHDVIPSLAERLDISENEAETLVPRDKIDFMYPGMVREIGDVKVLRTA